VLISSPRYHHPYSLPVICIHLTQLLDKIFLFKVKLSGKKGGEQQVPVVHHRGDPEYKQDTKLYGMADEFVEKFLLKSDLGQKFSFFIIRYRKHSQEFT